MIQLQRTTWVLRKTKTLLLSRCTVETVVKITSRSTVKSRENELTSFKKGFACLKRDLSGSSQKKLPELIVAPGSEHHNSLASFLEYAERTGLSPETTVYKGTHYEYTVENALKRLGFSLTRIGRRADAGIDLIGLWNLPQLQQPMPVIVQCKARADSLGPRHIRELEGAFQAIPARWRGQDVLGLLVTTNDATTGVSDAMGGNRRSMGFMLVSKEGDVGQFIWNRKAVERGLEGVGSVLRYKTFESKEDKDDNDETKQAKTKRRKVKVPEVKRDIQLTWLGRPISPAINGLTEETQKLGEEIAHAEEVEGSKRKKTGSTKKAANKKTASAKSVPTKRGPGRPKGSKTKKPAKLKEEKAPKRKTESMKETTEELKTERSIKESFAAKSTSLKKSSTK